MFLVNAIKSPRLYWAATGVCVASILILCLIHALGVLNPAPAPPVFTPEPPRIMRATVEALVISDTNNARLVFPRVYGLGSGDVAEMVNRRLERDFSLSAMTHFIEDQKNSKSPWELDFGFSAEQIGQVLHLRALRYTYTGGAHGNTEKMDAYVDVRTGAFYSLDDLFNDPLAGRDALAAIIDAQIATHPEDFFEGAKAAPLPGLFSFSQEGLVIEYPPYTIAPYSSGFLQFTIPAGEALKIIDADTPFFQALRTE